MNLLIYAMIICGSVIMFISILEYSRFMRNKGVISVISDTRGVVLAPLILMIMFLAGYIAIGIFVKPQFLIGGILFGGSLFVYLALHMLFFVVGRIRINEARLTALYEELRGNLEQYTKDAMAVFRVNLTNDMIEERGGNDLYEDDEKALTYSELLQSRRKHLLIHPEIGDRPGLFTREGLLKEFREGRTSAEEILVIRRRSGAVCFVQMHASMAVKPGSDDVVAFITEKNYNLEMVNDTILNKVLAEQYDMITYLVDGGYGIVVGDADRIRKGNIFPRERGGSYEKYIREQVAPVLLGGQEERERILQALSLENIRKGLENGEPYEVSLSCEIDGKTYYKCFSFFVVNPEAQFYILLKSDTTLAQEEHIRRNRQLEEALLHAQQASAAKTIFLSNMSHDIRTPMNAIIGFTGLAKEAEDPRQIREFLDKIDSSSQHLLDLINDVLEMSRIESGKMELHEAPMDLGDLMREIRELFALQMQEKAIRFTVSGENIRDPYVLCDRSRLSRILLNLISNAYKFTPEGGEVTVTFSQEDDGAPGTLPDETAEIGTIAGQTGTSDSSKVHTYVIRVRDTGIGMTPEFADKVFDAFERERSSTVSGIQGTGLGMAITKRIVDLMRGEITVNTEPGKGSEFMIRLSLKAEAGISIGEKAAQEPLCSPQEAAVFEGIRLLIVDDMAVNREIATMVLQQMGFITETAENGKEAVEKIAASPKCYFKGILMDIQMPVMDGYEATKEIRALPAPYPARIPIIAMSANAFSEDVRASLDAGMNAHVSKPIDIDSLWHTLEEVLGPACNAAHPE